MKTVVSLFEYFMAVVMTIAGVQLLLNYNVNETVSEIGNALENPALIIAFGSVFVISSLAIVVGKLLKKQKLHTTALMAMYTTCLFGSIVDLLAWGWLAGNWIDTVVVALIAATAWVYWKWYYKQGE